MTAPGWWVMESAKEPPPQAWKEIERWRSLKYSLVRFGIYKILQTCQTSCTGQVKDIERCLQSCAFLPKAQASMAATQDAKASFAGKDHKVMIHPSSWSRHCRTPCFLDCNSTMMLRIGLLFGPTCCYLVGRIMCFFIAEVFQSQCSTRSDLDISKFAKFVPVGTLCWRLCEAKDAASSQNAWGHGRWICESDVAHDDSTIFLPESSLSCDLWMKQHRLIKGNKRCINTKYIYDYMYIYIYICTVQYIQYTWLVPAERGSK